MKLQHLCRSFRWCQFSLCIFIRKTCCGIYK